MHIGVDATCWQNRRGYGRHARALLSALGRLDAGTRYTLFLDSPEDTGNIPPRFEARLLNNDVPTSVAAAAAGRRSLADLWRVSRAFSNVAVDALLFPTIYSFVPTITRARKLVMIHDVIAETFPKLTVPRLSARLFWKAKVAFGRWQADALITVSDYSRQRIVEYFGVPADRVFVVGEAADPVFRPLDSPQPTERLRALGIDGSRRTIAYVGGFSPHKNLEELVTAFAALASRNEFADLLLVMVGDYQGDVFHSYFGSIRDQVARLGLQDRILFPGFVPDDELTILLNLSTALVLPSLMEGFGLPAVEAAACGCPVIATRNSPLPELLGGGAIYITPGKQELEGALETLLGSGPMQSRMRAAARDAAGRLTWDAAARQMMDVMRKVVNS